jgi:hypothetical protein
MFRAALTSRSWVVPQVPHVQVRMCSGFLPSFVPHAEHGAVDGMNRPIFPRYRPYRFVLYSSRGLLEHLATLTRNQVRFTGTRATIPMLTEPTRAEREAFNLLGTAIPLTLK